MGRKERPIRTKPSLIEVKFNELDMAGLVKLVNGELATAWTNLSIISDQVHECKGLALNEIGSVHSILLMVMGTMEAASENLRAMDVLHKDLIKALKKAERE